MGYRHSDFVERCVECDAPTDLQCARCMKCLCATHLFTGDQTCMECESEWLRRSPKPRPLRQVSFLGALGVLSAGAVLVLGPLGVYGMAALGVFGYAGISWNDQRNDRAAFLAEVRQRPAARGLLPAGAGGPDARAEERQGSEG